MDPVLPALPEEGERGSPDECPVGDVVLLRQVLRRLDGRGHALHRQEGRQVGRVRGDDDEGEEPPHPPHDAGGGGLRVQVGPGMGGNWRINVVLSAFSRGGRFRTFEKVTHTRSFFSRDFSTMS